MEDMTLNSYESQGTPHTKSLEMNTVGVIFARLDFKAGLYKATESEQYGAAIKQEMQSPEITLSINGQLIFDESQVHSMAERVVSSINGAGWAATPCKSLKLYPFYIIYHIYKLSKPSKS